MSETNVHNELLYWGFDNSDFEKKAAQTLTTLQKLEKALKINTVVDIAKGFKLDSLAKDVDKVADRFTNLGIVGMKALEKLADKAVDTGEKFIKSLTIQDAETGWKKYEEQVGAVQTLMNTTGLTAKEIQSYVDRFAMFSDETSYSLDQMVKSFSQMTTVADLSGTAAEKAEELKKIQDMIIGIANASAFAGKTGAEFQRTIFNLTQSYQTGALKLMDWKSLQQAGTASKQMMEQLIKAAEDLYKETNGKKGIAAGTITLQNFNDTLKKGWATTEVMQRAFGEFSGFANAALDAVAEGKYDTVSEAMQAMADDFDDLSVKAFKSAQQAKTFTEALASVHDAVSTKWSESYRLIVGDYDEAVILWTNVANALWDIFAAGGDERNKVLKQWAGENGRYYLVLSLQNILNSILSFVNPIKEAWNEVFKPINGHQLAAMTRELFSFTRGLILSADAQAKIKNIATDFATALKTVLDILKMAVSPITTIIGPIDQLGKKILIGAKLISAITRALTEMISKSETAIKVVRVLLALFVFRKHLGSSIKLVLSFTKIIFSLIGAIKLLGLVAGGIAVGGGLYKLFKFFTEGKGAAGVDKVKKKFEEFRNTLKSFDSWKLGDYVKVLKSFGDLLKTGIGSAFTSIADYAKSIDWKSILPEWLVNTADKVSNGIGKVKTVVYNLAQSIQSGKLGLQDWKSIQLAGFGKESWKPFFEGIVNAGVHINKFSDIAKSGLTKAGVAIKGFFSKDILTGLSPFEKFFNTLKNGFSSKEGFIHLLELTKEKFSELSKIATAPWKLSSFGLKHLSHQLKGFPKLVLDASTKFKGLFDNLKNPETIKTFGRTLSDAVSSLGSKALGGIDTLTKGNFNGVLNKVASGFSKIRDAAGNIGVKGIDALNAALTKLHSLVGGGSGILSQGLSKIKDISQVLDVKLGGLGSTIIGVASSIKSRLPALLQPLFKVFDLLNGGRYSKILNLGKSIITDITSSITKLGGAGFNDFTKSLKDLFNTFASGAPITKTISKIKDAITSFVGIFKRGGSGGSSAATSIAAPVRSMATESNEALNTLDAFKLRLLYIVNGIKSVANKINEIIPPGLGGNIIKFIGLIAQLVIMKKVAGSVRDAFNTFGTVIKEGGESAKSIFAPFQVFADKIPSIFKPFEALAEGLSTLSVKLGEAIESFMDSLRKKWKAEAFETRANGILKMAQAVAVLAGAVWIVAQIPIDKGQLLWATGAIIGLMTALLVFATIFDKLGQSWIAELPKIESVTSKLAGSLFYFGKSTMIASLAISLIAMAGAIKMLMGPVKELSKMKFTEWASGFIKLAFMMGSLAAAVGIMGHAVKGAGPGIIASTILLMLFTTILNSFLKTMLVFGEMFTGADSKKVIAGAVGVGATLIITMGSIVAVANALSKFTASAKYVGGKTNTAAKALLGTAALLAGIVFFLNSMASIIKKFRDLRVRTSEILITLTAIGGILLGIAGYSKILQMAGLAKEIKNAGSLMIGFAGSLALVALALHLFSNLDMEGVGKALPAIIGAVVTMLGVIAVLGKIGGKVSLGSGIAILGFAAVITSLTMSLMLLTLVDYVKLEQAAGSLAKVLLSVGVAMGLAGAFSAKATAMIGFTFVIKELTTALLILSFIDYAKLESAANNLTKVLLSVGAALFLGGIFESSILDWIGIIGTIGAIVAALYVLQSMDTLKVQKMATVLGALEIVSGVMVAITGLLPAGGGARALAALAGASLVILALTGLLYIAGQIPDPEPVAKLLNSTSAFLLTTGVVIGVLGQLPISTGIVAAGSLISFFFVLGAAISALGWLSESDNPLAKGAIENLENGFTKLGEFLGDFAGGFISGMVEKAGGSLEKIIGFLDSVKELKDAISPEEASSINTALSIVKDLVSIDIPNDGGLVGKIFGENNIGDFGASIQKFGRGLRSFSESIQGITAEPAEIESAITMARGLADLAQAIPDSGESFKSAMVGVKDLGVFAAQISGDTFSGPDAPSSGRGFGKIAGTTKGLGASIKKFTESVKDIPDDAYKSADKAIKAAESIAKFAQYVPETGGFTQKIFGVHDMAQFALSLAGDGTDGSPGFVASITKFVNEMDNLVDPGNAVTKLEATQPLINFFKDNTSVWDQFTTSLGNYTEYNALAEGVKVLTGYARELSFLQQYNLDPAKLKAVSDGIVATEPAYQFFKDNKGTLLTWDVGLDNPDTPLAFVGTLKEYAHQLALLSSYDSVDAGKITSLAETLEASKGLFVFYEDVTGPIKSAVEAVKRHFDGGKNPLADAIRSLIPYAQALRDYSKEIDQIGDMNKVIRSTVAFEQFSQAVQNLFGAQNLTHDNSFDYIGQFTFKLGDLGLALSDFSQKFGSTDLSAPTANVKLVSDMLRDMQSIGPLSADGFVDSVNKLAEIGLDEFYDNFEDSEGKLNTAIGDFIGNAVAVLSRSANQDRMKTGAINLYKGFLQGQEEKLKEVKESLEKFITELPNSIEINESVMINMGMKIPYGLVKGIQAGAPLVAKATSDMMEKAGAAGGKTIGDDWRDFWKTDPAKAFTNLGAKIPKSITDAVTNGIPWVAGAVQNLGTSAVNTFNGFFGEDGSFIQNARTSLGGMFQDLGTMVSGKMSEVFGINVGEILNGTFVEGENGEDGKGGFIDLVKGFFNPLLKEEEKAVEEGKRTAAEGADAVGKSTKAAGSKAAKEAKAAGKEILTDEDAFWVALLAKKRAGANASEYEDMKVKDFEKKMLQEVNKLVDDYKEKLNSTTDDILGMIGLFDKVEDKAEETGDTFGDIFKGISDNTSKLEGNIEDLFKRVDTVTKSDKVPVSGDELMANLQDQIDKYTEYYDIQDELAKRINNNKLKKTLREMTIDSIDELKALNSMSDKELNEYVALFEKRVEVAGRDKTKKDEKESPTAELLTQNLEDQVEKYKEYKEVITNLNARVTSKKLKETLNGMNIDNMDQLKVIESMTDEELTHYTALFEEKYQLSKDTAEVKLEETKQVTEDKLNELLETTGLQLDMFLEKFDGTLGSLTSLIEGYLTGNTLGTAVGHMAQQLVDALLAVFNNGEISAEEKVAQISKAIEDAAAAGVDLTDQYSQGVQTILSNTEMTAEQKLAAILDLMTKSQTSLAQTSENLAQTTKDTIARILSRGEASKLITSLMATLNDGVSSAQDKIEKFKVAIQQAGENNVQLTETYRTYINQLLSDTTIGAETQVMQLLDILMNASTEYQKWALQDMNLLNQDLLSLTNIAQKNVGGAAKLSHEQIKEKIRETTDASEDEIEEMATHIESKLGDMTSSATSMQESFSNTIQNIVKSNCDATTQQAQAAADALTGLYSKMNEAQDLVVSAAGSSGSGSSGSSGSSKSSRDPISMWESSTGRTLTDSMKEFARNGGTIVGGHGSQIIKDGRYWDDANHTSYDLASGAARNAIKGYSDTISNGQRTIYAAGAKTYKAYSDGLTGPGGLDEHSPSKKMIKFAKFALMGWVEGIDKYSHLMTTSGVDSADSYIDVFNESMKSIEMPEDVSPVITPVIDMSRAQASMDALDNLFNTEKSYSLASDIKRATDLAAKAKIEESKPQPQPVQSAPTMNFTQNNYSPKALSKLDIYRQTKNQFAQMKGALA